MSKLWSKVDNSTKTEYYLHTVGNGIGEDRVVITATRFKENKSKYHIFNNETKEIVGVFETEDVKKLAKYCEDLYEDYLLGQLNHIQFLLGEWKKNVLKD